MTFNSHAFTEKDRYLLDVQGVAVKKAFLSKEQVAQINADIDKSLASLSYSPYKFNFFELSYIFCEILESRFACDACEIFLGPQYRFDHCMGIQFPGKVKTKKGLLPMSGNLHGGNLMCQNSVFTLDYGTKSIFGQLGLGIALSDQTPETGGFCYVLGSHRQPAYWQSGKHVFSKVLKGKFDQDVVTIPTLAAGDAFLFPDNLVHGTTGHKSNSKPRRSLYYKYVPGFAAWRPYEEIAHYKSLAKTKKQKELLRPPYVAQLPGNIDYFDNSWKPPTNGN